MASMIPVRVASLSYKLTYNLMMLPFELFFKMLNSFIPVSETLESSKDVVKDMTSSSMFAMTSIFSKYVCFF